MTGPPGLWGLVYTLRPPGSARFPVGYTMAIAEGMGVWAIMFLNSLMSINGRNESALWRPVNRHACGAGKPWNR